MFFFKVLDEFIIVNDEVARMVNEFWHFDLLLQVVLDKAKRFLLEITQRLLVIKRVIN